MRRHLQIWSVLVWICAIAHAQTASEPLSKVPLPESGFVSPRQYTSAFFGFTLSLPSGRHFQQEDLSASDKALRHLLFAAKSADKGFTMLIISANEVLGSPDDEAQKQVFLPGMQAKRGPEALSIGGRLFWKSDVEQKSFSGKVRRLRYATTARGFVVQFSVSSYNARLAEELRDSIESIKFFDPAKAKELAGPESHPFLPQAARMRLQSPPDVDLARIDAGRVSGRTYANSFLGFSYRFPDGWYAAEKGDSQLVKQTAPNAVPSDTPEQQSGQTMSAQCTRVLGSATKYPEEHPAEQFNPRITILAGDPSCYIPDLKFPTALQDKSVIEGYGQALVRSFAGTRFIGSGTNRLLAADLSGHVFLEVPSVNAIPVAGSSLLLKVHTLFVLTSMKRYWVMWLFESDSESELSKLGKTSISFNSPASVVEPNTH